MKKKISNQIEIITTNAIIAMHIPEVIITLLKTLPRKKGNKNKKTTDEFIEQILKGERGLRDGMLYGPLPIETNTSKKTKR